MKLTFNLVQVRMNPVQHFPKVNLCRVKEHHHRTWGTNLIGKAECETALWQRDPAFQTRYSTGWKVKLGQDITAVVSRSTK